MLSEKDFKRRLIGDLNKVNLGWVDGDATSWGQKTADVINPSLMIAIEIKDDTESPPAQKIGKSSHGSYSATKLNRRFFSHIKNANKKFREYQQYKTVLLFRTALPLATMVRAAVEGIHTFEASLKNQKNFPSNKRDWIISSRLSYSGRRGIHNRKEVGCFLIFNEDGYSYFPNEFATKDRVLTKSNLEKVLGLSISES